MAAEPNSADEASKLYNQLMEKENEIFIPCGCGNVTHHLIGVLDEDSNDVWLYINVNQVNPWYKRIWYAIKYVFKKTNRFGMYDELILNENNVVQLQKIVDHINREIKSGNTEL
jgi:hypothetical protein